MNITQVLQDYKLILPKGGLNLNAKRVREGDRGSTASHKTNEISTFLMSRTHGNRHQEMHGPRATRVLSHKVRSLKASTVKQRREIKELHNRRYPLEDCKLI